LTFIIFRFFLFFVFTSELFIAGSHLLLLFKEGQRRP
jgi:hypothetical protein